MQNIEHRIKNKVLRLACVIVVAGSLFLTSCVPKNEKLPIFGQREVVGTDTVYHTIAPFSFVDQDSALFPYLF